jgi:hypothetical protein
MKKKLYVIICLDSQGEWSEDLQVVGPFKSETLANKAIETCIKNDPDEFLDYEHFEVRELSKTIDM